MNTLYIHVCIMPSCTLIPVDYSIELTVDMNEFTVAGRSVINLNIVEETNYVIFHTKLMNITSFVVTQNDKRVIVQSNFTYEENDFYILRLKNSLSVGKATLELTYSYILRDYLVGFYRSSYKNANGVTNWIGTTQFEPTDARRAFPCFDEPALKANFTISLTHDSSLNAHSNMPVDSTLSRSGDMTTTLFETSVKMSTYLVAFVVSDFECVTQQTDTEPRVNVSATTAS